MQLRSLLTTAPVVALLALFVALSASAMRGIDVTRPELVALPGGDAYLRSLDPRLSGDAPPLAGLLATIATLGSAPSLGDDPGAREAVAAAANGDPEAPKRFGRAWFGAIDGAAKRLALLYRARFVTILFGALAGLFVFLLARLLFGQAAGLLALALYAASPEFLGRAHLVAPETPLNAFWLMGLYFLVRFGRDARRRDLALAGAGLGLAMAAHQAALFQLPIFVVIAALGRMRPTAAAVAATAEQRRGLVAGPLAAAGILCGVALAVLAVVLTGHLGAYLAGVDDIFRPDDAVGRVFLTGAYADGGFLRYFLVIAAAKTPLATLMLMVAGAVAVLIGRAGALRRRDLAALLLPLCACLLLAALAARETARPFLFGATSLGLVMAGGLLALPQFRGLAPRLAVAALALLAGASTAISFPHYLAYFNSVAGGYVGGPRIVADGNVDVGQDLARLGDYCRRRSIRTIGLVAGPLILDPARFGVPARRVAPMEALTPGNGYYAVSARAMHADQNWPGRPTRFDWYDEFQPVARVGETVFVYRFHTFIPGQSRPPVGFDGELLTGRRQQDRRDALLAEYAEDHPNNGWIQGRLGQVLARQESSHEAIEALERALGDPSPTLDPERAAWAELAAWQALCIGRLDTAENYFRQALQLRPERAGSIGPVLVSLESVRAKLSASFANPADQQALLAEVNWLSRRVGQVLDGVIAGIPTVAPVREQALTELAAFCRARKIDWIAMRVDPARKNADRYGVPVRAMQPEDVLAPAGWYAVDRADHGRNDLWPACAVILDWKDRFRPVATFGDTIDVYRFSRRAGNAAAPTDEGVQRTAATERDDAVAVLQASLARVPTDPWCSAELFQRSGGADLLARAVRADRNKYAVYRPRWLTMGALHMIRAHKFATAENFLVEIRVGGRIDQPWLDQVQASVRWLQARLAAGEKADAPEVAQRIRAAEERLLGCLEGAHFLPDRARRLAEAGAPEPAAALANFAWRQTGWKSAATDAGAWSLACWRIDDAMPLIEAVQDERVPRSKIFLCQALTFRGYLRARRDDLDRARTLFRELIESGVRDRNETYERFVRRVRWVADELRLTVGLEKVR